MKERTFDKMHLYYPPNNNNAIRCMCILGIPLVARNMINAVEPLVGNFQKTQR